jgi:drug/metabolite transporter (DMT)-like permease
MSELHQSVLSANGGEVMPAGVRAPHGVLLADVRRWRNPVAGASRYLWGLGAAAIWSGWWTVTRVGLVNDLAVEDLAAIRFGISGLLLLPLAWRERQAMRAVGPRLLLLMAAGAGAPYVLVVGTGVGLTSAGLGGAITVGLMPVFTLILSTLFLREKVTRHLASGIGCILLGAALVSSETWRAGGGLGLCLFVAGALMWAAYTVGVKRSGLPPLTATSVVCVASLALYMPVWLALSGPARLLADPAGLLLQILCQSLLAAIGALYCYGRAIDRLGAARASAFAAIVPLLSVIMGALVLHESPTSFELFGAGLLAAGSFIAARR